MAAAVEWVVLLLYTYYKFINQFIEIFLHTEFLALTLVSPIEPGLSIDLLLFFHGPVEVATYPAIAHTSNN